MNIPQLELGLHDFFELFVSGTLFFFMLIYLPAQLYYLMRRRQRKQSKLRCRLCGYRFQSRDEQGTCPHCKARNA